MSNHIVLFVKYRKKCFNRGEDNQMGEAGYDICILVEF